MFVAASSEATSGTGGLQRYDLLVLITGCLASRSYASPLGRSALCRSA